MTLTEMYNKPMKEVLQECRVVEQKVHTDDNGTIKAIEVKYVPEASIPEPIPKRVREIDLL